MAAFENFEKKFHEALDTVSPRPRREDAAEAEPYHSVEKGLNDEGVSLADFRAYMPQHSYIFMPSRELWPASSVNARLPPVVIGPNSKPRPVFVFRAGLFNCDCHWYKFDLSHSR